MRRGGVLLTLWLVVASSAIAVGTWALSMVGGEINHQTVAPLSNSAIDAKLRADRVGDDGLTDPALMAGPTGTAGTAGTTDRTDAAVSTRVLSTPGGTIVADCQNGDAHLVSWIAAQGYRADGHMVRGPAPSAVLKFESDTSEMTAIVRCVGNAPTVSVVVDSDHHGGASTPSDSAPAPTEPAAPTTATVTDDHGSGGHGADDGPGDDGHHGGGG